MRKSIRKSTSMLLAGALLAGVAALAIPAATAQNRDDALQMISVDVEGGGGRLRYPGGGVVVIDTGNPDASGATGTYPARSAWSMPSWPPAALKVDYLITTHYRGDHIGGMEGFIN